MTTTLMTQTRRNPRDPRSLLRDKSALAMVELAYGLPIFLALALPGIETTNFITTKMRMSQLALHIADNAARMGTGSLLAEKTISETMVNDVLIGADLQSQDLDIYKNGRVIVSNLEADPDNKGKFKITWQRCRGSQPFPSSYGKTGDKNLIGIGPTDRRVTAIENNATMFVELRYVYKPILGANWTPWSEIRETASMTVRERRSLALPIPNPDNVPVATC